MLMKKLKESPAKDYGSRVRAICVAYAGIYEKIPNGSFVQASNYILSKMINFNVGN